MAIVPDANLLNILVNGAPRDEQVSIKQKLSILEETNFKTIFSMSSLNSNNNSWAETQGIRFEISLPEQPIHLPKHGE